MSLTRNIAKSITDYDRPDAYATKLRVRRAKHILSMIDSVHRRYGSVTIIDIGGTRTYWNILPNSVFAEKNVSLTVVNIPGAPLPPGDEHFTFIDGDACCLDQFDDDSFRIAHSNSVLEHIGDWHRMMAFADTVRRLAPNYYVQTPFFWFPIEPHCMCPFFHWLPEPVRVSLVMRFELGHWNRCSDIDDAVSLVESIRMVDRKLFKFLFPDAVHLTERAFFLPKSMIAFREETSLTGPGTSSSV